jgi:hypothetical protein
MVVGQGRNPGRNDSKRVMRREIPLRGASQPPPQRRMWRGSLKWRLDSGLSVTGPKEIWWV